MTSAQPRIESNMTLQELFGFIRLYQVICYSMLCCVVFQFVETGVELGLVLLRCCAGAVRVF